NGANAILFRKEAEQARHANQSNEISKEKQKELVDFSLCESKKNENYVSELEMMSFLEDIEELSNDTDFSEYWEDLSKLKQKVIEQQCATEKEVLKIFKIRSLIER